MIGAYQLLGEMPPNQARLAEYVRAHHPRELKKLEQERRIFAFQQVPGQVRGVGLLPENESTNGYPR